MFSYHKKKLGEISSRKMIQTSDFLKIKNSTMTQLNRVQLTYQIPSHVKITKILSTRERKSRIIDS